MNNKPCECDNWCRDWRETMGSGKFKLPPSRHAPTCKNYQQETFYRVTLKGTKAPACIVEHPSDMDGSADEYDIAEIKMTRDQFEHLHDFEGY